MMCPDVSATYDTPTPSLLQSTRANMVIINPDWLDANTRGWSRPYAWFLNYRSANQ